jgi:short-chain 2-methylacyl-CoA dehydrogenase
MRREHTDDAFENRTIPRSSNRSSVWCRAMHFDLPDETRLLQRTVREFAEGEVAPVAEELDRTKAFPYEIVREMGELGWMGIPFPEEVGGAGGTSLQ